MGKTSELLSLLKTGNSDAARRLIAKFKKAGKKKALAKELNVPDDNGQTVIHFCAAQNFVEFLQDLAELGASVDIADNKGYTPLHLAAASGRTSAVTALAGMGADPNLSSRTGDTPLHLACHGGHATTVEMLVSENANCTMLNVSGYTPLELACQSGHTQVVSLLLRSGQFSASYLQRSDMPHTALMLAAKHGHNECIALLIKHGFDVNRKLPGGNGGTALHEAALHGRVDTVRYLIQCGVDVQKANAQGHTALDIVNMYADPRAANVMKQVLQDALAQLARRRMAQQQHAVQPAPHTVGHQPPPSSAMQQPPGFSYFPQSSQPMTRRESPQHRQVPGQHQTAGIPYPSSGYPQHQRGQAAGHPTQLSGQHQYPPPATGHHRQAVGGMTQTSGGHNSGHSFQSAASLHHSAGGLPHPPPTQNHSYVAQPSSHSAHHHIMATGQQPAPQQHQQQRGIAQASPPHNVQHIYPKPGSPDTVHKAPGIGGDLAAIIAKKAASRKPIPTSPTRKESTEIVDEQLARSMTTGGEPAIQQARSNAQQRRSSMSERSSASPERGEVSNPPMLPRRAQAGPPSFKPVPPPSAESRGQGAVGDLERGVFHQRGPNSDLERQTGRKSQPVAPPPATSPEDNELMAKLKRRQNKIIEAEQAGPEQPVEASAVEQKEEEPAKPPPPPQRKTPALNSVTQSATSQPQPPAEAPEPVKQKKVKPPPPKPKETEPEMSPWQQELAARRARMADHEKENEPEPKEEVHVKDSSPAPLPKPAPKPKRSKAAAPPASSQEHFVPPVTHPPPHHLVNNPVAPAPVQPAESKPSETPMDKEPSVVVERAASPPLLPPPPPQPPHEVPSLVADQLSRSTSMSSLPAGAASPQASNMEHMPVLEWLTSCKLADYASIFEASGYDTTELMVGMNHEELQEIGITKIGHRKKLMSALASWPQKEHFFQVKPESVPVWLKGLHMSQYENTFLEAGYDDIDFVCDMTLDDLQDIGVTKRAHVKRLLQGIGELIDLMKSSPTHTLEHHAMLQTAPSQEVADTLPLTAAEPSDKVDFSRMRGLLVMKMGISHMGESEEDETVSSSHPQSIPAVSLPPPEYQQSAEIPSDVPPQVPRKRGSHQMKGQDEHDSGPGETFGLKDITAALGEDVHQESTARVTATESEFDQLTAVLDGLEDSEHKQIRAAEPEQEPDQLLADIDDMLADLTTHLDFMIPGST